MYNTIVPAVWVVSGTTVLAHDFFWQYPPEHCSVCALQLLLLFSLTHPAIRPCVLQDESTRYICIGPVNKAINMLSCWCEDPDSQAFKRYVSLVLQARLAVTSNLHV